MRKLILLLALMLLPGCGPPPITSGEVCDRNYSPAHDEDGLDFDPFTKSLRVETVRVPDRWSLTFKRIDEKTGEWRTRTISVSKEDYEKFPIGSIIHYE